MNTEYKIMTATPFAAAMADGWKYQGGIASTTAPNGVAVLMQAIIRG